MSLFRFMQCFNSTMVRLKDPDAFTKFDLATFQFHYGTIKSNRVEAVTDVELTFNSTMVRLKELDKQIEQQWKMLSIPLWYD